MGYDILAGELKLGIGEHAQIYARCPIVSSTSFTISKGLIVMNKCKVSYCTNTVESEIKAWGKIIKPVNCKMHRTANRNRKAREYGQFQNALLAHNRSLEHQKETVCTFGDW